MPRLNLTDSEAALIEKLRARNAKSIGFNEGVEAAIAFCQDFLTNKLGGREHHVDDMAKVGRATLLREVK